MPENSREPDAPPEPASDPGEDEIPEDPLEPTAEETAPAGARADQRDDTPTESTTVDSPEESLAAEKEDNDATEARDSKSLAKLESRDGEWQAHPAPAGPSLLRQVHLKDWFQDGMDRLKRGWTNIKDWIKQYLDVEGANHGVGVYKDPESPEEAQQIKALKKASFIEFCVALGVLMVAMWAFWDLGARRDIPALEYTGYGIIVVLAIWALFISPIVHFKREGALVYRPGYLGIHYQMNKWTAFFEERGLGSPKVYYDYVRKDPRHQKILAFLTYYFVIGALALATQEIDDIYGVFSWIGMADVNGMAAARGSFIVLGATISLGYLVVALWVAWTWEATGQHDLRNKVLLVVPILAICVGWVLAAGGFTSQVTDAAYIQSIQGSTATATSLAAADMNYLRKAFWLTPEVAGTFFVALALVVVISVLFVGFLFCFWVRFDNLRESGHDVLFIAVLGIGILVITHFVLWNPATEAFLTQNAGAFPFRDRLAREMFLRFELGDYFASWYGYWYWGFVQELLFLGYFLTLLTKTTDNKWLCAVGSCAIFGFIHFPDWPLMLFTTFGGFFWGITFQKYRGRNMFMLGVSHGMMGTFVNKLIPISMSVGPATV